MEMKEIYSQVEKLLSAKSESTRRHYLTGIKAFGLDEKPTLASVTQAIADWQKQEVKPNTIKSRMVSLKYVLRMFPREFEEYTQIMQFADMNSFDTKVEVNAPTQEQAEEVIRNSDSRTALAIGLMYYCGLKVSDVVNLKTADIKADKITVQRGNEVRELPMNDRLKQLYSRYYNFDRKNTILSWIKNHDTDYVLVGKRGRLSIRSIERCVADVCRECNFPEWHCHSFRHGLGVKLANAGVNLATIQAVLGHKNITTTQVYMPLKTDNLNDAIKKAFE